MKKLLSLVIATLVLLQGTIAFADYAVRTDGMGGIVIDGVKLSDRETTILVLSSDGSELAAVGQIGKGNDAFEEILSVGEANSKTYIVKINGVYEYEIKAVSAEEARQELENASAEKIAQLLEFYNVIFGANLSLIDPVYDKEAVYEELAAAAFDSADDVAEVFANLTEAQVNAEKAIALELIADGKAEEALTKYIVHFNVDKELYYNVKNKANVYGVLNGNSYTEEEFENAFSDSLVLSALKEARGEAFKNLALANCDKIGMDLSDVANEVFGNVSAKSYKSFEELNKCFVVEISLYNVNNATRENIREVLETENDVLGILNSDEYKKLTESQKDTACREFAGGDYSSPENAIEEFAKIIAAVMDGSSYKPSTGNSSGGGGGSYGISGGIAPTVLPQTSTLELPFTDIAKTHWGYSGVAELYNAGIISGTSATTFDPNREVTREEFVKMLICTFSLIRPDASNPFADVPSGDWCEPYVASAYATGLTLGKGDGTFGKGETLTRQDMAVMAARCASIAGLSLPDAGTAVFADEADFADYAKDSIYALNSAGIINGVGDGMYAPSSTCTRVMAAKVCSSLYQLVKGGGAQ